MKKLFAMLLLGASVASVLAQAPGPATAGKPGKGGGPGGRMARMQEANQKIYAQLNLTADQKTKVKALDDTAAGKMKELMASAQASGGPKPGGNPEMREKFRAITKEHEDGLNKVLNKDQQKKYQELRKKQREEWMKNRPAGGGRPGGPPPVIKP